MTIHPDALIGEAVSVMRDKSVNSLIVVADQEIKGIIKRDDIIREVAQ